MAIFFKFVVCIISGDKVFITFIDLITLHIALKIIQNTHNLSQIAQNMLISLKFASAELLFNYTTSIDLPRLSIFREKRQSWNLEE